MFVQVIQGRTSDAAGMRAHMEEWETTLGPGATGWLGTTAGVTDSGEAVAVVRFASEEAARANSERPEQGEWWSGMESFYDGDPSFMDCSMVDVDLSGGDPGDAGFVQVMQGRSSDVERARELMGNTPVDFATFRPDILGRVWAGNADGDWTMAIYFTTEAAAREGEAKEPPSELASVMEELNALESGPPRFFDLRDPWLSGPA